MTVGKVAVGVKNFRPHLLPMGLFRTPQQHPFADMVLTYAAELLWAFAVVARNH